MVATLLANVNHPGSQEDLVSNWEPAHNRGCCLWAQVCPLPSASGCRPAASLPLVGDGLVLSWLALLWYSLSPLFCERASSALPLLLLLLSHFSRVRFCVIPETAAYQAPLSLGFSRQEHWSGLPFPSPMHESEK